MEITIEQAVKKLTSELKKDSDFYYVYQSNIALAFYDEFNRNGEMNHNKLLNISNQAAKNFLDLWINTV